MCKSIQCPAKISKNFQNDGLLEMKASAREYDPAVCGAIKLWLLFEGKKPIKYWIDTTLNE